MENIIPIMEREQLPLTDKRKGWRNPPSFFHQLPEVARSAFIRPHPKLDPLLG